MSFDPFFNYNCYDKLLLTENAAQLSSALLCFNDRDDLETFFSFSARIFYDNHYVL